MPRFVKITVTASVSDGPKLSSVADFCTARPKIADQNALASTPIEARNCQPVRTSFCMSASSPRSCRVYNVVVMNSRRSGRLETRSIAVVNISTPRSSGPSSVVTRVCA